MPRIERAIKAKVKKVIAAVRTGNGVAYLNTDIANNELASVIKKLYVAVGVKHARLNYSRLLIRKSKPAELVTKGFGFNASWTAYIEQYLQRFLLEKITFNVAATTRDSLLRILSQSVAEGWSIDQTVDKLEGWPGARYQSARIVRTEVNRAANVGATAQNETSQYQQTKEWIAVRDFRTRGNSSQDHASHVLLDGTKIDAEDSFADKRNGDVLQFPGDPKASAASTINCRCSVGYEIKRDLRGEPIPKRKTTAVIYPSQQRRMQTIAI